MAFLLLAVLGGVLSAGLLMPAVAAVGTTSAAAQQVFDDLPTELEIHPPSESSVILAADGSLLATYHAENRVVVGLDAISQHMINAVVATEDKRFYEHKGINPQGLIRAFVRNSSNSQQQGASTITQQYVKNVLIEAGVVAGDTEAIDAAKEADGAEGYRRKLREIKLAISLEKEYTKDQILEGYLNIAQFGASRIYGVEAASRYFFNKSAADLTPGEAALVAGITKSPGLYDPTMAKDGFENGATFTEATDRRNNVLWQMHDQGYLTDAEYEEARDQPLAEMLHITPTPVGCASAGVSAYFCEYVTKVLLNDGYLADTYEESQKVLLRGGLRIQTTINPVRQQQAYDSLVAQAPENDPSYRSKKGESGIAGAISSVEPHTGNIVAMVQNTTYGEADEEHPRATKLNFNVDRAYGGGDGFQTGSTFKAFVVTQWLIDGGSLSDIVNANKGQEFDRNDWTISCSPESIPNEWKPKNLETGVSGMASVLKVTEQSVNTAFAYMGTKMDLCALRDTTSRMGVHVGQGTINPSYLPEGSYARALYEAQEGADILATPSMVLGSNTIAPLTMAAAFATYAADGVYCAPRSVTAITDRDGNPIPVPEPQCSQALDPAVAAGTTHALRNVVSSGTATGARIGRPAAGKTGTANEDYHAWFIGYTPQLASAVWLGHSEGDIPMLNTTLNGTYHRQIYGGRIPAPIWGDYMSKAMEGMEVINFTPASEYAIHGARARVPSVIGKSLQDARATLEREGWAVVIGEARPSSAAEGRVGGQSPGGGASTFKSQPVTLYPSSGPETPEPTPGPDQPGGGPGGAGAVAPPGGNGGNNEDDD